MVRRVDRLVLACGRNADLSAVTDPLWSGLRNSGFVEPEPVTRLGVATDDYGRLIGATSTERIFAIGPMRQGSELVRNGRTGAFVFSIGTLRNQAHYTALAVAQLIRRLRLGTTAAGVPSLSEDEEDEGASREELRAVQLRVGYPMTRPAGVAAWDTKRWESGPVPPGAGLAATPIADLEALDRLERQAVESLTDISRLAPEIEERVALQRSIKRSLRLVGTKGRMHMNQITVELNRDGATATRAQIRDHDVIIDRPIANEGTDAGPMGGEMLLASIGGCFMSTFIAAARARSIAVDDATCEVIGTFADAPRRFGSIEVLVSSDQCEPDDLEHLIRVAEQGCIVMNTLRADLGLTVAAK